MIQDFRQSSEALRLSQVSKMLRQLSGQIQVTARLLKDKKYAFNLCLFRRDQGPHTLC